MLILMNCIANSLNDYIIINLTSTAAQLGRFPSEFFFPFHLLGITPPLLIIIPFLALQCTRALNGDHFITSTAFNFLKQRCAANTTTVKVFNRSFPRDFTAILITDPIL